MVRAGFMVLFLVAVSNLLADEGLPAAPAENRGPQGSPIVINNNQSSFPVFPRVETLDKDAFKDFGKPVEEAKTSKSSQGVVRPIEGQSYYQSDEWKKKCEKFKETSMADFRACYAKEKAQALKEIDSKIDTAPQIRKTKPSPFTEAAKGGIDNE